jgi:regulator of RNase E activity RraA
MPAAAAQPELAADTCKRFRAISTATLTMQLLKRGLRNVYLRGPKRLFPPQPGEDERIVGTAFTLRFVPMREDLSTPESYARPGSLREALESVPAGAMVAIDGCGATESAVLGDILALRIKARGAVGAVCDAAVRDVAAVRPIGLPIFCNGAAAPPSITGLHFVDWGLTIGCGGVLIEPGDVLVGDEDGVVVVPRGMADAVARDGEEQERFERFVQIKVGSGAPALGVYPPNEATLAEYQRWCEAGEPADWSGG